MYKIIGSNQRQYGPISADEVRRWIREGRLNGQTLAQTEGSNEWKTLALFPEFAADLAARSSPSYAVTGPAVRPDLQVWKSQLLSSRPELNIGRCLARGWNLLTNNPGLLFAAVAVVWAIESICQRLPIVGLVYWVFHGVLYGGLNVVFLKRLRAQPASVGDVFAGFKIAFVQLLLTGVLTSLLGAIGWMFCVVPGLYLFVAWTFSVPLVIDKGLDFWPAMELSRRLAGKVWFELFGLLVLAFLPVLLASGFVFVKLLVAVLSGLSDVFQSTRPDPQRILQVLTRLVITSLPLWIFTKIVLLLNLPFAVATLMAAYEDLFGTRPAPAT